MNLDTVKQIEELRQLTVRGLRARYLEVFGEESRSNHKAFLLRRIAWRSQALAEGDLSERARRRAAEIANDADLRIRAPNAARANVIGLAHVANRDGRLPQPGTLLTRQYRGQTFVVEVVENGFQYSGRHYRSLSAIARDITGTRWNGLLFFHLKRFGKKRDA